MMKYYTHEQLGYWAGTRKHRRYVYYNGPSLMKYSKFFYDRPSSQGFKKGLGINLAKPTSNSSDMETAMQVPGIKFGDAFIISADDSSRPFYYMPQFHIAMCYCGLGYLSFLIMTWFYPGPTVLSDKTKKINVTFPKIMLF